MAWRPVALRDCDETLVNSPHDRALGLPPWELSREGVRDNDGLWSHVGSYRSDSFVTGLFLLLCVLDPSPAGLVLKGVTVGRWS